mmetsp:Transcript_29045/g.33744  ORF Transcript_29045/g.33744 Transcript_29045/m.33744 type:complete len:88 (+) Transcript_29045:480-743(+)
MTDVMEVEQKEDNNQQSKKWFSKIISRMKEGIMRGTIEDRAPKDSKKSDGVVAPFLQKLTLFLGEMYFYIFGETGKIKPFLCVHVLL